MGSKSTPFAEATSVKQLSSHTYEAFFHDDWCIGSVPHGGYVTATFLQVVSAHFRTTLSAQNQPHTITLHLDFIRRTQAGPALFTVQDSKVGRQTSIVHATLSQGKNEDAKPPYKNGESRDEVVGYITNSNIHSEQGMSVPTTFKLSPPRIPVNLSDLQNNTDENWERQIKMPLSWFRKASNHTIFHYPRQGQLGDGMGDEWIRFSNDEKFTNASLGYVADTFPTVVEDYMNKTNRHDTDKRSRWYPTLVLNLDVKKALPEEGVDWLFVRVQAKQIKNGRMDLEVVILDEGGEIVALSHHVCLILGAERNLAKRTDGGSKI